jgi:hypothetical protein
MTLTKSAMAKEAGSSLRNYHTSHAPPPYQHSNTRQYLPKAPHDARAIRLEAADEPPKHGETVFTTKAPRLKPKPAESDTCGRGRLSWRSWLG